MKKHFRNVASAHARSLIAMTAHVHGIERCLVGM
jgi:hypothetical protein